MTKTELETIMLLINASHISGKTLCGMPARREDEPTLSVVDKFKTQRVDRIKEPILPMLAARILSEYVPPPGFDTASIYSGQDAKSEAPCRRAERVLVCFVNGLMRRNVPISPGAAYSRHAALFPLFQAVRPTALMTYGARHSGDLMRTMANLRNWRTKLVRAFLTPVEQARMARTCTAVYVLLSRSSPDQPLSFAMYTLSHVMPAALRNLLPDVDATPSRGAVVVMRAKWAFDYGVTHETCFHKHACVLWSTILSTSSQLSSQAQMRARWPCSTIQSFDEYAQLWYAYCTARDFAEDLRTARSPVRRNLIKDVLATESSDAVQHFSVLDHEHTRLAITIDHCQETMYPFLTITRVGPGTRAASEISQNALFTYVLCIDLFRGLIWRYGETDAAYKGLVRGNRLAILCSQGRLTARDQKERRRQLATFVESQPNVAELFASRGTEQEQHAHVEAIRVSLSDAIRVNLPSIARRLRAITSTSFDPDALCDWQTRALVL
jgi:hypothetical protein